MNRITQPFLLALGAGFLFAGPAFTQEPTLGLFEKHGDIGVVGKPGLVQCDTDVANTYAVTGGGTRREPLPSDFGTNFLAGLLADSSWQTWQQRAEAVMHAL